MHFIEIRCPFQVSYTNKQGVHKHKVCGKLCVKVTAGSAGEAYCASCSKTFEFEISPATEIIKTKVIARAL
jgi:hypothetical protein